MQEMLPQRASVNLVEVFSSIQGEGTYVGCRQVFVRLVGCNLRCDYCDTGQITTFPHQALLEVTPGKGDFRKVDNPLSIDMLSAHINNLLQSPHHSVSITGGEPLLQTAALLSLLPAINGKLFLETNGVLVDELKTVIGLLDIVSMDMKLPSAVGKEYWNQHKAFLQTASMREVIVKVVVTAATDMAEFMQAVEIIAAVNSGIPLIIQPVTLADGGLGVMSEKLSLLQTNALASLRDVRVIPQVHKYLQVL